MKIDNSETMEALSWAREALTREVPRIMKSAVELAAVYEKQEKTYTDRTGELTKNTRGEIVSRSTDECTAELILDTEYASYVTRNGYTAFNEAGIAARDQIQDGFDALTAHRK